MLYNETSLSYNGHTIFFLGTDFFFFDHCINMSKARFQEIIFLDNRVFQWDILLRARCDRAVPLLYIVIYNASFLFINLITSLHTRLLPKTTCRPSKKLSPSIVTEAPPWVHPSLGVICLMHGVATGNGENIPAENTNISFQKM